MMSTKWATTVVACLLSFLSLAQVPANDICANATVLPLNGTTVNTSNLNTAVEGTNPTCGGTGIRDVWFQFVYNGGGNVTLTTVLGTLIDTRMAVYGACGSTQIACNDDISGSNYASQIVLTCSQLVAGSTYFVQVGGFNATVGNFGIRATVAPVSGCIDPLATNYNPCATVNGGGCVYPVSNTNDVCANAIALIPNGAPIQVNNTGTTSDGPTPSCGGTSLIRDLWFSFVYTGGSVRIETSLGTNTDTRLAVYTSCGGSLIACDDDDGAGAASLIRFGCPVGNGANGANEDDILVVGQTYFIQAGGYQSQVGTFNIWLTQTTVTGCTNPNATNYNACATVDDGSCVFPPLSANFNYSPVGLNCLNIGFDDTSSGNVVSWAWTFEGATPQSSNSANPIVLFPQGGIYQVSLTVTDMFNEVQTITQNVIIDVGHTVTVDITNDNLPQQTSWALFNSSNAMVQSGTGDATFCIADNCHRFEIYDSGGNGICCANGNGSYVLYLDGIQVANGASFAAEDIRDINCPLGTSCDNPIVVGVGQHSVPRPNTWYSFTPTINGQYRISTCGLADCDTKIWVYDYCNMANFDNSIEATFTYNDDLCGVQAEVTPFLTGGNTYWFRVGDTGGSCGIDPFQVLFEYMGPIVGCMDVNACNYSPLASAPSICYYNDDPNCSNLGPDLYMDGALLFSSTFLATYNASSAGDACLVNEGCLQGMGARNIVRFSTRIDNIGTQDYFIGVPNANNPQFEYDLCHNHYHYEGYAEYLLFDESGALLPQIGFKNGFCVLDLGCTTGQAKFGCGNMGITAGCYDVYSSALGCQWLDITDVPAGSYHLVVRTNWDQSPDANGRYELRYDNNWAQVCISFQRDANNNIINFTKSNTNCLAVEDCLGQPFGDSYPDCEGNCPGIVKRGDLNGDNLLDNADVMQYATSTFINSTPVTPCTDLNNDGSITVADAAYLDECIHTQYDLGIPVQLMEECAWDDEIFEGDENVILGVANLNTSAGYFDITITNPNGEINAMEFKIGGATIDHVDNLLPITTWDAHIYEEVLGDHISVLGHFGTRIPVSFSPTPILRVYYSSLEGNEICISQIIDVLNVFLHNVNTNIGSCVQVSVVSADFEASATGTCTGGMIQFNDLSTGGATSWLWSMPGATPSTSTLQNPIVNYYSQGVFPVTLLASNANASDTETKLAYISVSATLTQYLDSDGDGYGNGAITTSNCNPVNGYVTVAGDCDDNDASQYPGATESCNLADDDCDTAIDEGFDTDGDGFTSCQGDCDDNNALRYPGAFELCNNQDDDCDTSIDEGFDADGDGFSICENDCNDNDASIRPNANEVCDGVDNNCNSSIDEGYDADGDGYSVCENDCNDANASINPGAMEVCNGLDDDCDTVIDNGFDFDGDGYSTCEGDCDDSKPAVYPGASEICGNSTDDDCDTAIDEGFDLDGDGWQSCQGDCNDLDAFIHPGASEICDGINNNCSGGIDEGFDLDGDGFTSCNGDCNDNNSAIRPGVTDVCNNGIDDDCDTFVDEGCGGGEVNNEPIGAIATPVTTSFSACVPTNGNFVGADPSPQAQSQCITGEDLWYSFVATSTGVRIRVETSSADVLIELQDANGTMLDFENARVGIGTEILNYGNLTEGETYRIAVRNYNSALGTGAFSVCLTRLQDSWCNSGPGPYSLCATFKAVFTGAQQYLFHFTSTTTGITYTGISMYNYTRVQLGTVSGMRWDDTYSCRIDALYTIPNGTGQSEVVTVVGNTSCPVIINPHVLTELRVQDRCPASRTTGATVSCTPWVCGAVDYEWEFTQLSPLAGLPQTRRRGSADRTFRLSDFQGIAAPATYSVRVRPIFEGEIEGEYGPAQCIQTVGSAGLFAWDEEEYVLEERLAAIDEEGNDLLVFPNPSSGDAVRIIANNIASSLVNIDIIDALGRVVYSESIFNDGNIQSEIIFNTPLASGWYTVRLQSTEENRKSKLIIRR